MNATDALSVLRQQHAGFENDKLTSEDPHFTIVMESQQRELEKHILFLENATQAREIAQIDLRSLRIIDGVRVREQQALSDRRFATRQTGRVLDLTSVQTQMREGEAVVGHFSPAYIRAASQPLLVGRERFLSEDTLRVRTSPASPVNATLEPEQGEPITINSKMLQEETVLTRGPSRLHAAIAMTRVRSVLKERRTLCSLLAMPQA